MFVWRKTFDRVLAQRDGAQLVVHCQGKRIAALERELGVARDDLQAMKGDAPVRGARGRFTKRGAA